MKKLSRIVGQLGVWLCNLCRYRNLTELEATLHREHVATVRSLLDALAASETERDRLRPAHDAETRERPESGIKEANVAIVPYATVDGQPCDGNGRMLPEAER